MKKFAVAGILGSMIVASQGFAAFSIDQIHQAAKIATDAFQSANPTHVQHFTGYKAWKSGEDLKTKIYVSHDGMNMEFNYNCHNHDGSIECHAQ